MALHSVYQKRKTDAFAEKQTVNSYFPCRSRRFKEKTVLLAVLLLLSAFSLFTRTSDATEPVALNDSEMAAVTGQSGLTLLAKGVANISASVVGISDKNGHTIEFRNFTIDDGIGGYFSFDTPWIITDTSMSLDPTTIDVYTNAAGQPLVYWRDTMNVMPRWYSVGDLVFCDQSLGSLNIDAVSEGPTLMRFGGHSNHTAGIDFDISKQTNTQAFRFTYNTTPEALTFSGIHVVGSATGANDNPADPSTWSFTGTNNVFRIGNIDAGNPATMDVGTDPATGTSAVYLNLPMEGSIRVENVNFGGNNFGPIAIDGIKVHRLSLQIKP
jgi:hypothetical protein